MALKRIIPLTAIVILLLISATVPALALVPNGQRASEFQLTDLSSNVHALSSYRGKVVVIDFFMVSCSACKEDAKMNLVPLYAKSYSGDAKVQFLSVETSNANAATVRNTYLKDTGVPWPVLTGGGGLIKTYNFVGVPTIYVIDSTGKVALTMSYPTNVQTLKSTIDRLEHGTTTPAPAPTPQAPPQPPTTTNANLNGQRASEFQLTDLSSNVHALSSYRGKVVVIDFFMVSCSACKEDAKMNLVPLYAKSYSGDAKVQFLSVETSNANAATVRNTYLKDTGVPWPVLTGGGGLFAKYSLPSFPTIYVIDSTGKVALTMSYPTNVQTLKSTIDRLEHGTTTPAKAPTSAKSNVP